MTANFRLSGNQQPFHSPYSVSLTSSDPYTLSFTPWWRHRDLGGTTRDQLLQDVVILATFAAQQRFIDPESGFSRPRTGLKYDRTGGRRPTIRVPLEKGGFRCLDDRHKLLSEKQRATSCVCGNLCRLGGCFAVGCVIDDMSRTLKLVIASKNAIEQDKRRFIETLWSLLQQVPVVLGTINLLQPLSDLRESPLPADTSRRGYVKIGSNSVVCFFFS